MLFSSDTPLTLREPVCSSQSGISVGARPRIRLQRAAPDDIESPGKHRPPVGFADLFALIPLCFYFLVRFTPVFSSFSLTLADHFMEMKQF